jgi:hypothetical protein
MRSETTVGASPAQFKVGDEAKVVMEVERVVPAASIEGNVVEKQTETVYRRSGNAIKIAFDAATPVLMGKVSDVHEGAVIHVTATMGNDRALHASQIVVLTGYVKVKVQ